MEQIHSCLYGRHAAFHISYKRGCILPLFDSIWLIIYRLMKGSQEGWYPIPWLEELEGK